MEESKALTSLMGVLQGADAIIKDPVEYRNLLFLNRIVLENPVKNIEWTTPGTVLLGDVKFGKVEKKIIVDDEGRVASGDTTRILSPHFNQDEVSAVLISAPDKMRMVLYVPED